MLNVQGAIARQEIGSFQSYNELNETTRMRTSLEQAEMEKTMTEEKQKQKKDEPCDCGGTSTHHMILYEVNDGPLIEHLCIGSKAETQTQVGRELYTKKEHNVYVKQRKAFASEYTNPKEINMEMETPESKKDREKVEKANGKQQSAQKEMLIDEKSRRMYVGMVQYNFEREKEKTEKLERR
ncbi:hypothetical protein JTB14_035339 [Gonioctena quinquepunctata]|nr:hypothetical protein JTB14_035339 [Gonioctena quinquepunctata]